MLAGTGLYAATGAKGDDKNKVLLIEGFEDISRVRIQGGQGKPIKEGPGLTQGAQAVELPPGAAVTVRMTDGDISKRPWLRLDTHTVGGNPQILRLSLSGGGIARRRRTGCVQAGKDTLAYPLSTIMPLGGEGAAARTYTLQIAHAGDAPVVIDNLRLEPPAEAPEGGIFWDFGPGSQRVWPGFKPHRGQGTGIRWRKDMSISSVRAYSLPYPDPLAGDFIGYYLTGETAESIHVDTGRDISMLAWVWFTHYGRYFTQPADYLFRAPGRSLRQRLSSRQLLGPRGLLEGADGAWTPQWYARDYAKHFGAVVNFTMTKGRARLDLGNCQLAAMAMGPVSQRPAMFACVQQIQKELARYRRQFIVGLLDRNLCTLEPTDAEKRAGMMVFQPPGDEALMDTWRPSAADRIPVLRAIGQAGGTIRIPLAVVLLKRSLAINVIRPSLRSEAGGRLIVKPGGLGVDFIHRVAQVRSPVVRRRPWLISSKSPRVEAGESTHLWLRMELSPLAKPGVYCGPLGIICGAGRLNVPMEVEVVDGRQDIRAEPLVGSQQLPWAYWIYAAALTSLSPKGQHKLQADVDGQARAAGLNAYFVPAVRHYPGTSGLYLSSSNCRRALSTHSLKGLRGPMFFDLSSGLSALGPMPGSGEALTGYKKRARQAVSATNSLASKYAVGGSCFYIGSAGSRSDLALLVRAAKVLSADDCRIAIGTSLSVLRTIPVREIARQFTPAKSLLLYPNAPAPVPQIAAFKNLNAGNRVYLMLSHADRYAMGFYASAIGADGCFVSRVFMTGRAHNGFYVDWADLLALHTGGVLAETVSAMRIKQALDDWDVIQQAKAVVDKAGSAKVSAAEITAILAEIGARAAAVGKLKYSERKFATTAVSHAEMDSWRASLLNAIGVVAGRRAKP